MTYDSFILKHHDSGYRRPNLNKPSTSYDEAREEFGLAERGFCAQQVVEVEATAPSHTPLEFYLCYMMRIKDSFIKILCIENQLLHSLLRSKVTNIELNTNMFKIFLIWVQQLLRIFYRSKNFLQVCIKVSIFHSSHLILINYN